MTIVLKIVAVAIGTWYVWSSAYLLVEHPDLDGFGELIGYGSGVLAQFAFGVFLVMAGLGARVLGLLERT